MPRMITLELMNYIIYKIENKEKGIVYIGVTSRPLRRRWAQHKYACANNGSGVLYPHMRLHGIDTFEMVMIEELSNVTKREAEMRESYWFTQVACINEKRSYVSDEEQRENAREKQIVRNSKFWELNRERINERNRTRLTCACGVEYTHQNKTRHVKSQHHQQYIQEQHA